MTEKETMGEELMPDGNNENATDSLSPEGDAKNITESPNENGNAPSENVQNEISNSLECKETASSAEDGADPVATSNDTTQQGNDAVDNGNCSEQTTVSFANTSAPVTPKQPYTPPHITHQIPYQNNRSATTAKKESSSALMPLAATLSGVSILCLFCLMIAIMLGVIFMGGDRVSTQVQISGSNSQITYTDDTEMIKDFIDSVVIVSVERTTGTGVGSGIIYSQNGYIVTNYHVVSDTVSIYVKLHGDSDYIKAELVGYSEHDDVAVLKIDKTGLRPATFVGDCSTCLLGERVYAIGSPEGTDYSWTVTQGIISSINRILKFYDNEGVLEKKMRVIQTDAAVNPGNSGGPLINSRGEVVGIITMKLDDSAGMGFALPSDGVIALVNGIIETGSADHIDSTIASGRPLMGITCVSVQKDTWYKNTLEGIEEVTKAYALANPNDTFYAAEDGVYVKGTSVGMDAYGKLEEGDIITEINGTRVYTQYQMMAVLNDLGGGDSVTLTYYRNSEYYTVDITLKEMPIE